MSKARVLNPEEYQRGQQASRIYGRSEPIQQHACAPRRSTEENRRHAGSRLACPPPTCASASAICSTQHSSSSSKSPGDLAVLLGGPSSGRSCSRSRARAAAQDCSPIARNGGGGDEADCSRSRARAAAQERRGLLACTWWGEANGERWVRPIARLQPPQ